MSAAAAVDRRQEVRNLYATAALCGRPNDYNAGGYIKIEGGDSRFGNSADGGDIELNAGSAYDGSTGNAGHVYIRAGTAQDNNAEDGRVTINTAGGDHAWQFNNDGTLNIAGHGVIRNPNNGSRSQQRVLTPVIRSGLRRPPLPPHVSAMRLRL